MYIGKPDSKMYYRRIDLTQDEFENLQYIIEKFMKQIDLVGNTHYQGDKMDLMKKIVKGEG